MKTMLFGSYKTTVAGILGFVAVAATQVGFMFDNDVATNPDWTLLITAGTVLFGLLFAADGDKGAYPDG